MTTEQPSSFELLQALLEAPAPRRSHLQRWLPSSGTLPQWNASAKGRRSWLLPWLSSLRSLAQVIFINNPLSGAVLLLAFLLESPWMVLLALVGTAGANLSSRCFHLASGLRQQGIHGFNGALVGCAAAVLGGASSPETALLWLLLVLLGSAATTLLLEAWSRVLGRIAALPPLTLPFCLVSWGVLALAGALPLIPADPAWLLSTPAAPEPLQALLLGVPRSFAQVFLCSGLGSGLLVLLATALASPLTALFGVLGALAAMVLALLLGVDPQSVAQGLWGYNGVLVAIAIGGIFYAPTRRSLLLAIAGAALCTPLSLLLPVVLPGLPPLTIGFVLITWLLKLAAGRTLPALMPVSLHAVVTPEEHRERFQVARAALRDFRLHLSQRAAGSIGSAGSAVAERLVEQHDPRISQLFASLDRDGDGSLSVQELQQAFTGLVEPPGAACDQQLAAVLMAMDLDGNGLVDHAEFSHVMQRLQRLRQGEERLLLYLKPADANGDDRLGADELERLLLSIGQPPLNAAERRVVFGEQGVPLRWRGFVDRLLLT